MGMRIRTANRRRRRAHAREVRRRAFEYHVERCRRLEASGRLGLLGDSGFIRRLRKKSKRTAEVCRTRIKWYVASAFRQRGLKGLEPLDDPADGGPMHYHLLDLKPVKDNY